MPTRVEASTDVFDATADLRWARLVGVDPEAQKLLRDLDNSDPEVRHRAIRELDNKVLDVGVLDRLAQLALSEPDATMRKWTLHTLACDFCKPDDCDRAVARQVVDVLLDRMENDRSRHVRRYAASCLVQPSRRDEPVVRAALHRAASADPSTRVRSLLTPMLVRWGWISPGDRQAV